LKPSREEKSIFGLIVFMSTGLKELQMSRTITGIMLAILSIIGTSVLFVGAYGGVLKPEYAFEFYSLVLLITVASIFVYTFVFFVEEV